MSELDDPRVLFAAERTLLAWNRTASGLMALGFIIDRGSLLAVDQGRALAMSIGVAFILLGALLNVLAIVQYRRTVATLNPGEIPARYWLNLSVVTGVVVALLGVLLAVYIVVGAG